MEEEIVVTNELIGLVIPRANGRPHWQHEKNGVIIFAILLEDGSYLVGTSKTVPVVVHSVDHLLEVVRKFFALIPTCENEEYTEHQKKLTNNC